MTSQKNHNKRRNVALMYEFLVGVISRSLVEGNKKSSSKALKILRKHFKPGTELYKEFRLVHALRKTTVMSEAVAGSILQETKNAVRSHDTKELDRQKSLLIRDINHQINDENFYDQQVNEYRFLATVQTLFNDWRKKDVDLQRVALYEDQLVKHLMSEKLVEGDQQMSEESPGTNRLMMKIMMQKLNEKYSSALNEEQKGLIRAYAFSTANDNPDSIKLKLLEIKESLLKSINFYAVESKENNFISEKLQKTKEALLAEDVSIIDDALVTRFMLYTKLGSEIESPPENNDV